MTELDPLKDGVWILAHIGNRDIIAKVEGCNSEQDLRDELLKNNGIRVCLKRKYFISLVQFPIPEMEKGRHTGGFATANLCSYGKQEFLMDFNDEFLTYAFLNCVSFLSDMSPSNIDKIRKTIITVDESIEIQKRANKANITLIK